MKHIALLMIVMVFSVLSLHHTPEVTSETMAPATEQEIGGLPRLILRQVGHYDTLGEALKVDVVGDFAYVADGLGGLRVIDVSDPSTPAEVAAFHLASSNTRDVVVTGNYAYTADGPEGLQLIDISDPKLPVTAGWYDTSEETHDLAVAGKTAYVVSAPQHGWFGNLQLFDLTDPAGSGPVSNYWSSFDHIFSVAAAGDFAYVTGMEMGGTPGSGSRCGYHTECSFMDVVDVSDPSAPARVGDYYLSSAIISLPSKPDALAIAGQVAYADDGNGYLQLIDISDPYAPTYVGRYGTDALDVTIVGQIAYVAAGEEGIRVLDVSDPTVPHEIGVYKTTGITNGVATEKERIYVADGKDGLIILEATVATHAMYLPLINPRGQSERWHALMALYYSTNGPGWLDNTGWGTTEPHCNWHGVTCDGRERATQLRLPTNALRGPIPPELGNLNSLGRLNLNDNQLSGPIPPELGNLSNLEYLLLDNNQLSGPIPPELGNLSNLQELNLDNNQLSDPIPPEIGSLSNLTSLNLSYNQLSSPIPPELGSLSSLTELNLHGNQLSDLIPAELGNLSSLLGIRLQGNQLSGPIPADLGNLSNLEYLLLDNNQLSGPIPAALANLSNLQYLYLNNNPDLVCWQTESALNWANNLPIYMGPGDVCP